MEVHIDDEKVWGMIKSLNFEYVLAQTQTCQFRLHIVFIAVSEKVSFLPGSVHEGRLGLWFVALKN